MWAGCEIVACANCGAEVRLEPHLRTATCLYCASPNIALRPARQGGGRPAFVVPFVLSPEAAQERVRTWIKQLGILRENLSRAEIAGLVSVYVPAYLYSATAHVDFWAAIGLASGHGSSENIRWSHLQGRMSTHVTDVLLSSSRGISKPDLEGVGPYDLRALHRYSDAFVSGWLVEEAQPLPTDVFVAEARHVGNQALLKQLADFLPGEQRHIQNSVTHLSFESYDLVLLPLSVLTLRRDAKSPPLHVYLNGQTGKVLGHVPRSRVRTTIALLLCLVPLSIYVVAMETLVDRGSQKQQQQRQQRARPADRPGGRPSAKPTPPPTILTPQATTTPPRPPLTPSPRPR